MAVGLGEGCGVGGVTGLGLGVGVIGAANACTGAPSEATPRMPEKTLSWRSKVRRLRLLEPGQNGFLRSGTRGV